MARGLAFIGVTALALAMGPWLSDGWTATARAQPPPTVAFDMDPAGNVCPGTGNGGGTDCTITSIDNCVQVTAGQTFSYDIVVQNLPAGSNYAGPDFFQGWSAPSPAPPAPYLQFPQGSFTLNSPRTLQTVGINLLMEASGTIINVSGPLVPHFSSPDRTAIGDLGTAETNPPYTQGVIGRYSATVAAGTASGVYGLVFDTSDLTGGRVYVYDISSIDLCQGACTLVDANTGFGLVAVNTFCPSPVGGIAELPNVSGSSAPSYIPLAALAAAALLALTAGAWYARRRWLG